MLNYRKSQIIDVLYINKFPEYRSESNLLSISDIDPIISVTRRLLNEPLAYILNYKNFYGYEFYVNQDCLIPRFTSEVLIETLVQKIISVKKKMSVVKILDTFSGSGCLGITLAKELYKIGYKKIHLILSDLSPECLDIININAQNILSDTSIQYQVLKIDIMRHDLYKIESFDILIANPPYIPIDIIDSLDEQIKKYEPHIALNGGADGLLFYPSINEILTLSNFQFAAIEFCDNQANAIQQIFSCFNTEIYKDLSGSDRFAIIQNIG